MVIRSWQGSSHARMPCSSSKDAEKISSPYFMSLGSFQWCLSLLTVFQLPRTFWPSSKPYCVSSSPKDSSSLPNPFCFCAEGSWGRGISGAMCAQLSLLLGPAALSCTSLWLGDLLDPSRQRFYPMQQPQLSPCGCLQQQGLRSGTWECSNTPHIFFQAPPQRWP